MLLHGAVVSFHRATVPFWDSTTIYLSILLLADVGLFPLFIYSFIHSIINMAPATIFVLIFWCLSRSRVARSQECTSSREYLLLCVFFDLWWIWNPVSLCL